MLIVNDEEISDDEVALAERQLQMQPPDDGDLVNGKSFREDPAGYAKDAVIGRVLVRQEAVHRSILVPKDEIEQAMSAVIAEHGGREQFKQQLVEAEIEQKDIERDVVLGLQVDKLLDEVCCELSQPETEELKAYFDEHVAQFSTPEQIRVSHIVKHVSGTVIEIHEAAEELQGILASIRAGTPFEKVAQQTSDCPDNAGDLGYFARGAMVPEFEDVVFNLAVDEVSDVFQTPFGVHIAKLYDRIPSSVRAFEEVQDEVREVLHNAHENRVIDEFTEKLRARARIEES
jgi:parvulin-like peptidyl-prolyl isomerase